MVQAVILGDKGVAHTEGDQIQRSVVLLTNQSFITKAFAVTHISISKNRFFGGVEVTWEGLRSPPTFIYPKEIVMAFHVLDFISFEHTDLEQKDHFQSANNSKILIIMTQL